MSKRDYVHGKRKSQEQYKTIRRGKYTWEDIAPERRSVLDERWQLQDRESMEKEDNSRFTWIERQLDMLKRAVLKKDGTFKEYGSARNTSGGGPIVMGHLEGSEGREGPPGPQGPRGLTGATGLPGSNGLDGNADFMVLSAVPDYTNTHSITQMDYKITGSTDMLASHQAVRGTYSPYYSVGLLFKPGVYEVTVTFRRYNNVNETTYYAFDIGGDYRIIQGSNSTNDPGRATDFGGGFSTTTSTRTFIVPNNRMFYLVDNVSNRYYNDAGSSPQIMFKRIGHVEVTGTASTLNNHAQHVQTDLKTIAGGIYWIANHVYPPSGYHPSDHPSQGGSNEFAAIEVAEETAQTVFGWIHRIKRFI